MDPDRKRYLERLLEDLQEAQTLLKGVTQMSIEATDARAAENATAPRISLADIESEICHTSYMTGSQFISAAAHSNNFTKEVPHGAAGLLTICLVSLKNGFQVLGRSAPAAPENFKEDLGRKLAYEDCIRQIWPLMGYQLKEQLHKAE